jgi:hypothetical protein
MLRLTGVLVALGALGGMTLGGAATASPSAKRETAKITMEKQGRDLFFVAPDSVEKGAKLKVQNLTNPRRIGPHTFTLAKKGALPKGNKELNKCGRFELPVCAKVGEAHEIDFENETIGKLNVENGKKGWDAAFSSHRAGDSWFAEKKNQTESRKVTAPAGKTLHFFCVIHPFMQGKIKVEG